MSKTLSTEEIVAQFPILGTVTRIVRLRSKGLGPPATVVGFRVHYDPERVQAWLDDGGDSAKRGFPT